RGGGKVKNPTEFSDTGTIIRIFGGDSPTVDPSDVPDDNSSRIKLRRGGTVTIDPWEKVGPKFRPVYQVYSKKNGDKTFSFNKMALLHFLKSVISLAANNKNSKSKY